MELGPVYTCSPVLTLNKAGPSWHTKVFVQWVKEFQSLSRVPEKSLPWGTLGDALGYGSDGGKAEVWTHLRAVQGQDQQNLVTLGWLRAKGNE